MKPLTIDDMKHIELQILDEIDRICRKHDLRYLLGYGTLLGAMRHGGFIPWDDDIDIMMPREDYETLLANFDTWKGNARFKVSSCRKGNSVHPFAKIVNSSTLVSERYLKPEYTTGVWVDIFPLDRIPTNIKKTFQRKDRISFLRALSMSDPHDGTSALAKAVKTILVPFAKNLNPAQLACQIDENATSCEKSSEDAYMVIASSAANPDKILPAEWLIPLEVEFEGRRYFAPQEWDKYLTFLYGDWHELPPEEKRHQHTTEAYLLEE